jgi:hypothetical protein
MLHCWVCSYTLRSQFVLTELFILCNINTVSSNSRVNQTFGKRNVSDNEPITAVSLVLQMGARSSVDV